MRKKLVATILLAVSPIAIIGCQSASQMAWWKSAKKSDIESTAIAHSAAPQLPSDVAKQEEKLAATSTTSGGINSPQSAVPALAASNPGTMPTATPAAYPTAAYPSTAYPSTAYPSTSPPTVEATGYPSSTAASMQTSYPKTQVPVLPPAASQVSAMTMPYDPTAVPPHLPSGKGRATTAALAESATRQADRYGVSPPVASNPVAASTPGSTMLASTSTAHPSQSQVSDTHGRYATTNQPGYRNQASSATLASGTLPASKAVAGIPYPTTTGEVTADTKTTFGDLSKPIPGNPHPGNHTHAINVVSSGNFRPGGTSNYPSTAASLSPPRVATRLEGTAHTQLPPSGTQLPSATESPQQIQIPGNTEPVVRTRYR